MRATESFKISNKGAGTYPVQPDGNGAPYLNGGKYMLAAHGTWGGGNLALQMLLPDNSTEYSLFGSPNSAAPNTWVASLTADGAIVFELPPGIYQLVVTTATAVYAALTRIPTSE